MNLRKRKSTEKQAELRDHSTDDTENTNPSFLTEEERELNNISRGGKRVKVEEVKSVLNETIKIEDSSSSINDCEEDSDWEEVDEKPNVSEIAAFKSGIRY